MSEAKTRYTLVVISLLTKRANYISSISNSILLAATLDSKMIFAQHTHGYRKSNSSNSLVPIKLASTLTKDTPPGAWPQHSSTQLDSNRKWRRRQSEQLKGSHCNTEEACLRE